MIHPSGMKETVLNSLIEAAKKHGFIPIATAETKFGTIFFARKITSERITYMWAARNWGRTIEFTASSSLETCEQIALEDALGTLMLTTEVMGHA
ncbi:hypothetical protein LCGC14_0899440 [marine sediment metagenome]|uniref:Uncharacterized protein n=1 Tax=marine sediment metagenome TaxID=412755 RepID=A0A0F9PHK7_9ZZZZ